MRVLVADLEEIDNRAQAAGLDRSNYIIRAATGQLSPDSTLYDTVEELRQRVRKLELTALKRPG